MQIADKGGDLSGLSMPTVLALSLQVEYRLIFNYPRVIDQIVGVHGMAGESDESVKTLKRLGLDSVQHAHWTAGLIRDLGRDPELDFEVFDTQTDIAAWLLECREREKFALSLYERAKSVAEQRQTRMKSWSLKGRLSALLSARAAVSKSGIEALDRLVAAEREHVQLMDKVISELKI
ncbi:MAG: hypothetical protein V3U31_03190 [Dehalococcoidia bacterium]